MPGLPRAAWAALLLLALARPAPGQVPDEQQPDRIDRLEQRLWALRARAIEAAVVAFDALALRPLPGEPAWSRSDEEPLLRFVLVADAHLEGPASEQNLRSALDYVDQRLRPRFGLLAGDNVLAPPDELEAAHAGLRDLLAARATPWYHVKGDNDARGYEAVFGTSCWELEASGMRVVGLGLDLGLEREGFGVSLARGWLREALDRDPARPTFLLLHEPLSPPTFLDAPRLAREVRRRPQVVAVLSGHLHEDLDLPGGVRNLVAPAVGFGPGRGIKELRLYADEVIVRTHEADGTGRYRPTHKWQRLRFPPGVRAGGAGELTYRPGPARPTHHAEGLLREAREWLRLLDRPRPAPR